eukprot:767623-Hanusia_phi.AAC.1
MSFTLETCTEDGELLGVKIYFELPEAVGSRHELDLLMKQDDDNESFVFCLRQTRGKDEVHREIVCRCPHAIKEEHVKAKLIRNRTVLRVFAPIIPRDDRFVTLQGLRPASKEIVGISAKGHDEQDCCCPRDSALRLKGNEAFRAGDFEKALRLYSDSLEMWQGNEFVYTNRALCYMKQKEWEAATRDCLECMHRFPLCARAYERLGEICMAKGDPISAETCFQVALRIHPEHSGSLAGMKQLVSQLLECNITSSSMKANSSASQNVDGTIQYVLECLRAFPIQLHNDHEKGRCIKSSRDVQEGEVLMEASPLAAVVNDKYSSAVCAHCFNLLNGKESIACENECGGVFYCSMRCRVLDSIHHEGECPILSLWSKSTDGNQKRGVRGLRLFLRLVYAFSRSKISACLLNLLEHDKKASKDSNLLGMARVINRCEPNAIISFDGNKLVVRALEDIERETEITIAYVELFAPLEVRRDALLSHKGFLCRCSRCRRPPDHPIECKIAAGPKEAIIKAQEGWNLGLQDYQSRQLKSSHVILVQIRLFVLKLMIESRPCKDLSLYDEVLKYARLALEGAKVHLHRNHPVHALMEQHYADALMRSLKPNKQDANASYERALRVLQTIYGRHHRETLQVQQKRDELGL